MNAFGLAWSISGKVDIHILFHFSSEIQRNVKPNTHPMLEVVSWLGLFEYHIEAGVVSIHFKTGGTHGRIEEGFNKGKSFEEEMTSLDGNPNLSGYFSKYHKLLQLYTNGLGTRTTMYSDGKIVTSSWSHTSTSVQV